MNGSFEDVATDGSAATNWDSFSAYNFAMFDTDWMINARTGNNVVWMGGALSETTVISQVVQVESSAKYLAFYYKTISSERCGPYSDKLGFYITSPSAQKEAYYEIDVCKNTVKPTWTKKFYDLSGFVGYSDVVIELWMVNDTLLHSSIFIDDIGFIPNPSADVNYRSLPPPRLAPQPLVDRRRTP